MYFIAIFESIHTLIRPRYISSARLRESDCPKPILLRLWDVISVDEVMLSRNKNYLVCKLIGVCKMGLKSE
jgi:hypothetical protein